MNKRFAAARAALILLFALGPASLHADPDSEVISPSPDQKWECHSIPDQSISIVKAGATEPAADFSDQSWFGGVHPVWAPDSKRIAFNYGRGREHLTALYQLRDEKWIALKTPGEEDAISRMADNDVKAQIRKAGLIKKMTRLRMLSWTVKLHKWVNANTAILYVLSQKRAERGADPDRDDLGYFGAAYLFTLKFDEAGRWKIVKTHEMSDQELEKFNADE